MENGEAEPKQGMKEKGAERTALVLELTLARSGMSALSIPYFYSSQKEREEIK